MNRFSAYLSLPLLSMAFGCVAQTDAPSSPDDQPLVDEVANATADDYADEADAPEVASQPTATSLETVEVDPLGNPTFVAAGAAFAGGVLHYRVEGGNEGIRIDEFDGLLTIEGNAVSSDLTVQIIATNELGSVSTPLAIKASAPVAAAAAVLRVPADQAAAAKARSYIRFSESYGGATTNAAYAGPTATVLAMAALGGNSSVDDRVLGQIRDSLDGGHAPLAAGGYAAQHELGLTAAYAIASKTPRIWSQLTAAERDKVSLLLRAEAYTNAYTSSDKNPDTLRNISPQRNMRGNAHWRSGNPNFRCAAPAHVQVAQMFFGTSALQNMLQSFNMVSFTRSLQKAGLTNTFQTFMRPRPKGKVGAAPSASQVQTALKNWTTGGHPLRDTTSIFLDNLEVAFSGTIEAGYDNGHGIYDTHKKQTRGLIMSGASTLPNKGAIGMIRELDSHDAEGIRSSMSYSMWAYRVILSWFAAGVATHAFDLDSARLQQDVQRMNVGVTDMKYKSTHGYRSFSHGGGNEGNNEDWTSSLSTTWGWSYSFGLWTDTIRPYVLAQ